MKLRKNIFYRLLCVTLVFTLVASDPSFAYLGDSARSSSEATSCLAPQLISGIEDPSLFLWQLMGDSLADGLEQEEIKGLIQEILSSRFGTGRVVGHYRWDTIQYLDMTDMSGMPVKVLKLEGIGERQDVYFSGSKLSGMETIQELSCRDRKIFVSVEKGKGVTGPADKPADEKPAASQAPEQIESQSEGRIETEDTAKSITLSDKLKQFIAGLSEFLGRISRSWQTLREGPVIRVGAFACALVISVFTGVPIVLGMPCDRMYYLRELRRQREEDSTEDPQKLAKEIEKSIKDMGEALDEFSDAVEEAGKDDLESQIGAGEKHDIREITIQAIVRYLQSGDKDKDFEELLGIISRDLANGALTQDDAAKIRGVLDNPAVKDKLKNIYDKAKKDIKPAGQPDIPGRTLSAKDTAAQQTFAAKMGELADKIKGHQLALWIMIGGGISFCLALKYIWGINCDILIVAMTAAAAASAGPEEAPEEAVQAQKDREIIEYFTNNLDDLAARREIDDTYYLAGPVSLLNDQLVQKGSNNAIIVGDPTVTQGLVESAIVRKDELNNMRRAHFYEINTTRFIDSLAIPGQLERELRQLVTALSRQFKNEKVVLVLNFQDFFDMYVMKGGRTGSMHFQLIEAIESENISVVVLANHQLYETKLAKEKEIPNKFGVIDLRLPHEYDLFRIARNYIRKINTKHQDLIPIGVTVSVKDEVIKEALRLSQKYYTKGLSVNKLQEVIDRIITTTLTKDKRLLARMYELKETILKTAASLKTASVKKGAAKEIEFLESSLDNFLTEYEDVVKEAEAHKNFMARIEQDKAWEITLDDIAALIAADTGIPLYEIIVKEDELLAQYVPKLKSMLIGQDNVIEESYHAFNNRRVYGSDKNQPIGVYLLLGPTGVGKTEFARSVARHMFGSEDAMVRIDMSEYMGPTDDQKLIGPPPGYIGYAEGGQLTNHVLRRPYSVVLLDEIEKAHPNVCKLLLQVFGEGELRDGKGRIANFRNTIIILTSNLGFSQMGDAEKKVMQTIDEMVKTVDKHIEETAKLADDKTKVEMMKLELKLSGLKAAAARQGASDADIDKDIREIETFLDEEHLFADYAEARRKWMKQYFDDSKDYFSQAKKLTVQEAYKVIAEYKDGIGQDKSAAVIEAVRKYAAVTKEWYRRNLSFMEQKSPDFSHWTERYVEIVKVTQEKDDARFIAAFIAYLRVKVKGRISDNAKEFFSPELLNRIGMDNIISFDPLSAGDLEKILDIKLRLFSGLLRESGYGDITLSGALRAKIIKDGYEVSNGARPLERSLRRTVLAPLAEEILGEKIAKGSSIEADISDGVIVFRAKAPEGNNEVVKHKDTIEAVKSAGDVSVPVSAALGDLSVPVKEKPLRGEALKKFYEIDIARPQGDPDDLNMDVKKLNEKIAQTRSLIGGLTADVSELERQLRAARDDQQRQAVSTQVVAKRTELAIQDKKLQMYLAKRDGKIEEARDIKEQIRVDTDFNWKKKKKEINDMFENITLEAHEGLLRDLHPPHQAIMDIATILKQKRRNYPMLLNESPLVQKLSIESFVDRTAKGSLKGFDGYRVLRLKLETLKDYFSMVGAFESRMKDIVKLIEDDDEKKVMKTVIVIDFDDIKDELERIRMNPFMLGYFLRMFKGLKTVSFIMTTSRQSIVEDDSFDQFFSLAEVPETDKNIILANLYLYLKELIVKAYVMPGAPDIEIDFEALEMGVKIWERYFSANSAVEMLTRWFSGIVSRKRHGQSRLNIEMADSVDHLLECLESAGESAGTTEGLAGSEEVMRLVRNINSAKTQMHSKESIKISADELLGFVKTAEKARTGIDIDESLFRLEENKFLLDLESKVSKRIIHQDDAVGALSRVVRIAKAGLKNKKAPIGSFIFAGPTGVGKTQLAKTLADILGMSILRVDMSQYPTRESLNQLIGAPPGYIGYEEGEGYFFEHMRKHPKTIIIFDEIEKAHPDVMNILLQVMEDGRLTSNKGNTVKFNESIIILTSNMGMKKIVVKDGVETEESLYRDMEEAVRSNDPVKMLEFRKKMEESIDEAAKRFFRPEFLNRIDAIQIFNPLPFNTLHRIVEIFLEQKIRSFRERQGIDIEIGVDEKEKEAIYDNLARLGYVPEWGARPMEKAVERHFQTPMVAYMRDNAGVIKKGYTIRARFIEGKITFEHFRIDLKQTADVPPEDIKFIEEISGRLAASPDEPLTRDDMLEILGIRKEVEIGEGEFISLPKPKARTNDGNFLRKDQEIVNSLELVGAVLPAEIKPLKPGKTPRQEAVELKHAVYSWVTEAVRVAKMANLESYVYHREKRGIKNFYGMRAGELNSESARYFDPLADEKDVQMTWNNDGENFTLGVIFNTGITRYLQRQLFGKAYASAEEIDREAPRQLAPLMRAAFLLKEKGGKTGFFREGKSTCMWISVKARGYETVSLPGDAAAKGEEEKKPAAARIVKKEEANIWGGESILGMTYPVIDAAFDSKGNVYTLTAKGVHVYSPNGSSNPAFGKGGFISAKDVSLNRPRSIAVGPQGNIFVTNGGNDTVSVISPDGRSLDKRFGSRGIITKETGKFTAVGDIVVNPAGLIYVANEGNVTVSVLNPNGKARCNVIGDSGVIKCLSGEELPGRISMDIMKNGNILLAVSNSLTLYVIRKDGLGLDETYGNKGLMKLATDINATDVSVRLDPEQRIWVCDEAANKILVISPNGRTVEKSLSPNGVVRCEPGMLDSPRLVGFLSEGLPVLINGPARNIIKLRRKVPKSLEAASSEKSLEEENKEPVTVNEIGQFLKTLEDDKDLNIRQEEPWAYFAIQDAVVVIARAINGENVRKQDVREEQYPDVEIDMLIDMLKGTDEYSFERAFELSKRILLQKPGQPFAIATLERLSELKSAGPEFVLKVINALSQLVPGNRKAYNKLTEIAKNVSYVNTFMAGMGRDAVIKMIGDMACDIIIANRGAVVNSRLGARIKTQVLPPAHGYTLKHMPAALTRVALERLKAGYPAQYDVFMRKIRQRNTFFVEENIRSSAGIINKDSGKAFILEKETYTLLDEAITKLYPDERDAITEAFIYILLMHEATELLVRRDGQTLLPDINAEIAAFIYETCAYKEVTEDGDMKKILNDIAGYMDARESHIEDRFMPVFYNMDLIIARFPHLITDNRLIREIEAFIKQDDAYKNEACDQETVKAYLDFVEQENGKDTTSLRKMDFNAASGESQKELEGILPYDNPAKGQSLILYSDDLLDNAILYDFESTLKFLRSRDILTGGQLFLYTKKKEYAQNTEALRAAALKILGSSCGVVVLRQWEKSQLLEQPDPVKEIKALSRIAKSKGSENVLAVIRSNGINWPDTFKNYKLKIPLIIINNEVEGLFSFMEAVKLAVQIKRMAEILGDSAVLSWIKCLEPVSRMTEKIKTDYLRYRDEILVKA